MNVLEELHDYIDKLDIEEQKSLLYRLKVERRTPNSSLEEIASDIMTRYDSTFRRLAE